jgi:plastocyanin
VHRRRSLTQTLRKGAACLCLAAALAACEDTVNQGHVRVLRFALSEYRINPQSVRVTAGALTIVVRNVGRLTHNFVISRDKQTQAQTRPLPPGTRSELTVILTPGTYDLDSSLFSDQALGLYGTLTVTG